MRQLLPLALLVGSCLAQRQTPVVAYHGGSDHAMQGGPTITQSGSTITISKGGYCTSGQSIFYTTNGESPTIASTLYSAPVTSTTGEVFKAICATATAMQNIDLSSTDWKVCTAAGTGTGYNNGTPNSTCGGGVGTNQPSTWSYTWNPYVSSVSTTASTGETQILNVYGNSTTTCDNCTELVQSKYVTATQGSTYIANNESDEYQFDSTIFSPQTTGIEHMGGFQCNQSGTNAGYWQYDNVGGSGWVTTAFTNSCPWPAGTRIHFESKIHWINGDTGCGGLGCIYYDWIRVNGVEYDINATLEAATTTYTAWGNQEQIDLTNTTTSGANPTTAGRNITQDNVSLGMGDESATSSYTAQ